jgi:hypothetical protein
MAGYHHAVDAEVSSSALHEAKAGHFQVLTHNAVVN